MPAQSAQRKMKQKYIYLSQYVFLQEHMISFRFPNTDIRLNKYFRYYFDSSFCDDGPH